MNILFLTQIIPYPPDAGPRVKTWHVLRYLASRNHRVILASFVRPEEELYIPRLEEVCQAVHTVPIRRSRLADVGYWLRSNMTGRPFLIERDDQAAMRELVAGLVSMEKIDVIHADQLGMAQFALPYAARGRSSCPMLVFDAHNAVWTIVERMRQNAFWMLKPPAYLESRRVKQYEGKVIRAFTHTLAVTEPDRQALLEAAHAVPGCPSQEIVDEKISVVPIAVDTRRLQPSPREPGSTSILTLGTLHYPPNADGIRWFLDEVFPLVEAQIPSARVTIIGRNPPADFLQRAERNPQSVQVTGYVPALDPWMDQSAIVVVPVRAGGGMRVRILEAFARGMPVVTTTVGLEGIEAEPGCDVLVGDTPQEFAACVVQLLQDQKLQSRLAANGRRLAEECYDWQVVLSKMDRIYAADCIQAPEMERYPGSFM